MLGGGSVNRVFVDSYGQIAEDEDAILVCTYKKIDISRGSYYINDYFLKRVCDGKLYKYSGNREYIGTHYNTLNLRIDPDTMYCLWKKECERVGADMRRINELDEFIEQKEACYRKKLGSPNLRGMPMEDLFGRPLKFGDFVYFFEDDKPCYGLVASDMQVFSNYVEMKTLHHVVLMGDLCEREKEQKADLQVANRCLVNVIKRRTVKIGDIYKSKGKSYLFLGNFDIAVDNYKQEHDSSWLQLNNLTVDDLNSLSIKSLASMIQDFVYSSVRVDNQHNVTSVKNVTETVPRTCYFVGHIDLHKDERVDANYYGKTVTISICN